MKTPRLLLLLLFVANVVFGQNAPKVIALEDKEFDAYFANKNNIPKVKGKILNLSADEISKTQIRYSVVTPLEPSQQTNTCSLEKDGSFELKLDYAFPYQQIWIRIGNLFYTGVYANKELFIELDAAILKQQNNPVFNSTGVKYMREDGKLNNYTNNHILYKRETQLELSKQLNTLWEQLRFEINAQLQHVQSTSKLDYPSLLRKYDSLYAALRTIDLEYIRNNPSDFAGLLQNERQSDYYEGLFTFFWGKKMPSELFAKVVSHKPYAISNAGMGFYSALFYHLRKNPTKTSDGSVVVYPTNQLISRLDSLFTPSKADLLKLRISNNDPQEQKQLMEAVLPSIQTAWCKSVMNAEYTKVQEKVAAIAKTLSEAAPTVSNANFLGKPVAEFSFGAKLYSVDKMKAEEVLSALKGSFKDKAILMDIWATWCGPCIHEFPHSQKLSADCKTLPVEFVYLCTSSGSDLERWKSRIAQFELSGTHIFLEESVATELMSLFSKSGFPSYVLINRAGQYQPGFDQRPSNLTKDTLAELIK